MTKLIFGCGYLGSRVAERWHAAGDDVVAVTRDNARAKQFSRAGYRGLVADVLRGETLQELPLADTVLFAVGFDRNPGASMRDLYVCGLKNVLDALPDATDRIIYVSSTGVYGQSRGEWVDEDSACEPKRAGGQACLEAERALQSHRLGQRAVILRMAGLYGPGRIPNAADLRRGEPIAVPPEGYLNLIHIDDAAAVVLAAARQEKMPRTYAVSDGSPAIRGEYYAELARLLGAPPPRFAVPEDDSPAAARAGADKRVSNARMLRELRVTLKYASYRQGLAAIVA